VNILIEGEFMSEEISKSLEIQKFSWNLFGFGVEVSESIIVMWIVMAFLIIAAFILTRNMKTVPEGKQSIAEIFVEFINNFAKNNIGHHYKLFAPYLGTVLLFLVISNIISVFNIFPNPEQLYELTGLTFFQNQIGISMRPPTKDINISGSLAIITILIILFSGIKVKGFNGWLKSFAEPIPIMIPFKILDYFIRPMSLCFRLFGNILGAYIIMELAYAAIALAFPAALSIYFDIFDGGLQAYIFVFLTSLYVAEAIE
jgi:F-type H+-transporting ATPase subunit a